MIRKKEFITLRKVDLTGEKHVACKYAGSSWARLSVLKIIFNEFLVYACIWMFFSFLLFMLFSWILFCEKGMSHKPSPVVRRMPFKICLLFFVTIRSYFMKTTVQPSSHNWPSEIRLWLRFLKKIVFVALLDSDGIDTLPC